MAELATAAENRHKLTPGSSLVTADMISRLEATVDDLGARFAMPTEFVIPGQARLPGLLDVARTVVRRAERLALAVDVARLPDAQVVPYLNRLSTLLWAMARWQEGDDALPSRSVHQT
jgi:cob(I)alamin adenosyltransferase